LIWLKARASAACFQRFHAFEESARMASYTFLFLTDGGAAAASPDVVDCISDAEALGEACTRLMRRPGADAVEVWADQQRLIRLGARSCVSGHTRTPH
jgi:hypothetical protein